MGKRKRESSLVAGDEPRKHAKSADSGPGKDYLLAPTRCVHRPSVDLVDATDVLKNDKSRSSGIRSLAVGEFVLGEANGARHAHLRWV